MSVNHQARWQRPASTASVLPGGLSPRAVPWLLAMAAAGLLAWGKWHPDRMNPVRQTLSAWTVAIADIVSQPLDAAASMAGQWKDWTRAVEENRQLRLALATQNQQAALIASLRAENAQLRRFLPGGPVRQATFVTAHVLGLAGGAAQQSLWIDAGANQGIAVDQAVLSPQGVIGRVLEVGNSTARVLLMTDADSRLPVVAAQSRLHAIAVGEADGLLALRYLPHGANLVAGELVTTAGDGQVLPANLPVGIVEHGADGGWRLRPLADLARLDLVRVVQFDWQAPAAE